MFGLGKKKDEIEKPKGFTVKATVIKGRSTYDTYDEYTVIVEGSGFTGQAKQMSISSAFEKAYEDLMSKVSEAIFQDDK